MIGKRGKSPEILIAKPDSSKDGLAGTLIARRFPDA